MHHNRNFTRFLALGAALSTAGAAHAQVATAIVREGAGIPNGPVGETITSISTVMANNANGYAVRFDSTGSGTTLSHIWGAATGGPGAVLRTESALAGYTQTAFEAFFGVSDTGQVSYSPTLNVGDSSWLDATPIVVDSLPASVPGRFWSFGSRPLVTGTGVPYCAAGLSTTAGGATSSYALVKGLAGTVLFQSGDTLPGMPGPIGTSATPINFDYAVSASDAHYILTVKLAGAATALDEYVIYDGSVLNAGGSPVIEGGVVPLAVGGNGVEKWGLFDFFACADNGAYLITGDTDGAAATDEFVMVNGVFTHREGDVIDGFPMVNGIQAATMNESGSIALVWEAVTGAGPLEVLILDDQILLTEGDTVDLDGDGIAEPTSIVRGVGGTRELALSSGGDVYATASIDINGTTSTTDDIDVVLRIAGASAPVAYCTAGTTTNNCNASISASNQPSVSLAHPCQIDVASVEGQKLGLVFYGIDNTGFTPLPWGTGSSFLCLKTPTQRSATQNSGGTANACDGAFTLDWNAYQLANPGSLGNPWSIGDKVYLQGWFRDPAASKTTNLSDAIELTYVP